MASIIALESRYSPISFPPRKGHLRGHLPGPHPLTRAPTEHSRRRNVSGVTLYAEIVFPQGDRGMCRPVRLDTAAGRRRAAQWPSVQPMPGPGPRCSRRPPSRNPCLLLTTPGLFKAPGCPRCSRARSSPPQCRERWLFRAGALARGGPKPNRFAAAAGSCVLPRFASR